MFSNLLEGIFCNRISLMQLGFLLILITKKISLLIQLQFIIELNKISNRKYFENYIIYIVNHSRFFNLLFELKNVYV